jgi:hypothetical protein
MSERIELTKSCKDLLDFAAGDLIPMLEKNKKLQHVKQKAFEHYSEKNKEFYHVQVIVTRHEPDFLEDFTTEEMSSYNG